MSVSPETEIQAAYNAGRASATVRGLRTNPFDGATTVSFRLGKTGPVELDVFGIDGRHVRRLIGWPLPPGTHSIAWNGRNDDGRPAPSGVYLIRLRSPEGDFTGRVARLR